MHKLAYNLGELMFNYLAQNVVQLLILKNDANEDVAFPVFGHK
jgi:hypothetical protein